MAAGEGSATITKGGQSGLTHINLQNNTTETWKVVFTQEGESLTVAMTGPRGGEAKGTGKLKEKIIEWTVKIATPRGELEMAYKGVIEGDTMSGEVRRGNIGTAA